MSRSNSEEREGKKLKYASARKRAEKKQREASFSATYLKLPPGLKLFKPKEGVMLLDILPFRAGEGNPCAEEGLLHYERTYHLHARVGGDGGSPYLCPRLTSKAPCPICEYRQNMLKKSDPDDEKMIKDLAPKERQLFNVINLKEPDKGVQLWDMSYHLFGKLLDARIRNSDEEEGWDQFAALSGGMTLKVGFKEKSFGGRTFLEAETIDFKARSEDYDDDKLEEVHCLDELLIEPEYDVLKEAFLEAAPPAAGKKKAKADEDDEEEPAPKKKAKPPVDDEDDEDDEEEEPKVGKKSKPPVEEDDEDDDDEEEPAPKKKSKPPVEEDDEDDDDEEEPAPKKKATGKKDWSDFDDDEEEPAPKKKAKPAAEEEEEDEDDEEEEPAPKKKTKPAPVEDDDEDEEDDEEEPAPKKRKSRAKVKPEPEEDEEEDDDEEPPQIKAKKPADDDDEE